MLSYITEEESMSSKLIGYLAMVAGALLLIFGLVRIVKHDALSAGVILVGVLIVAVGWYIARKNLQLPGVK
jgi:uncharacterized membrane protein YiaA